MFGTTIHLTLQRGSPPIDKSFCQINFNIELLFIHLQKRRFFIKIIRTKLHNISLFNLRALYIPDILSIFICPNFFRLTGGLEAH